MYRKQGNLSQAEVFSKQALDIDLVIFGEEHIRIAEDLNQLAGLYDLMGRDGEAEPLYVRSLNILTAKLGLNHPDTQRTRTNLATLYDNLAEQFKQQGRYDKVVEYLEQAIQLR
jgi:tetratricopeptide (TPR) repeat protein